MSHKPNQAYIPFGVKFCWNTATLISLSIVYGCFHTTSAELYQNLDEKSSFGLWQLTNTIKGKSQNFYHL